MAKVAIGVIVVMLVVAALGIYFISISGDSGMTGNVISDGSSGEMKMFVLTGENFKFFMNGVRNPELRVQEGDKVRIEFTSTKGFHDWRVDEFNAVTVQVKDGGSASVEFVANKKGIFEYYCGIGQHRSMGMKGKLIVE